MLSFRPWWRILTLLGVLALLPLAWRGVDREAPILIQQLSSDPALVPPAVVELSPRASGPAARTGFLVAEAAEEPGPPPPSLEEPASTPPDEVAAPADAPAAQDPEDEPSRQSETAPVNLNTADRTLLQTLPGIGPALAARIIEYRERWGPFTDPRQLLEVSGIGEKRLEQLLPWVTVE